MSCRMTDVQGAVGIIQLDRLKTHNAIRRKLAYHLNKLLASIDGITIPYEIPDVKHVYHLYNIMVDEKKIGMTRNEFIEELWQRHQIRAVTKYFPTVNCLPAYKK